MIKPYLWNYLDVMYVLVYTAFSIHIVDCDTKKSFFFFNFFEFLSNGACFVPWEANKWKVTPLAQGRVLSRKIIVSRVAWVWKSCKYAYYLHSLLGGWRESRRADDRVYRKRIFGRAGNNPVVIDHVLFSYKHKYPLNASNFHHCR